MKSLWIEGGAACLLAAATLVGAIDLAGAGPASPVDVPVLVELFTSEGCSSCPPADDVLTKLMTTQPVAGAHIIAMGEHVDYWDHQGWRDAFSSALFSTRQSEYAARVFHNDNIYTPQMVVDGRQEFVGSDYAVAVAAIERAARDRARQLTLSLTAERTSSTAMAVRLQVNTVDNTTLGAPADVLVAITEDGLLTHVRRGENGGRDLRHTAVVRALVQVGTMSGGSRSSMVTASVPFPSDWKWQASRIVAFVQDHATRRVLGATSSRP